MSIGNLKTEGGKGTNWPWQYKMLLGLDKIASAIVTGGKDYESDLVSITCAGPVPPPGTVLRLEVRVFDTTTGAFTSVSYYEPGSITPDPADYSGCTKTYLEAGDATEATLQDILTKATANEANTADIATNTSGILADTANIETNTDTLRNSSNSAFMVRTSGALTPANPVKSISVFNAGAAAGTININSAGAVNLETGETVNFDAGGNGNKFPGGHFALDGTGTTFLVIYVE